MRLTASLVLIGLGANVEDPTAQISAAIGQLRLLLGSVSVSLVYKSAPVGYAKQPDFVNLVGASKTLTSPLRLLQATKNLERALGRTRSFRNAPRTIDIDLLAYGDAVLDTPNLVLPHPRLHQRAFVLVPLTEIAPEWRHPIFGKTAAELLAQAGPLERIELVGRLQDL